MLTRLFLLSLLSLSLSAQNFFTDFPPYFDYQIVKNSRAHLELKDGDYQLLFKEAQFEVGCRQPAAVNIAFSFILKQAFLFEDYNRYLEEDDEPYPSGFQLILYGVAKQNLKADSLLKASLADYCVYGQHNYVYETKDYILFTYQYAFNGGGNIAQLSNLGLWSPVLESLEEALEEKKIQSFESPAFSNAQLMAPNFDWEGKYWMISNDRVADNPNPEELKKLALQRDISPAQLKLKSRHRGQWIANFNQERSNWFKDKARWWRAGNLVFVLVEGWNLKVFRILDEGLLLALDHHCVMRKVEG